MLLVLLLIFSAAAGCSGGGDSSQSVSRTDSQGESSPAVSQQESSGAEEEGLFNAPGELPIVKEPVTLSIFAPANGEYSWKENTQTLELEEKTGIHLDWHCLLYTSNTSFGDEYSQKVFILCVFILIRDLFRRFPGRRTEFPIFRTEGLIWIPGLLFQIPVCGRRPHWSSFPA